MSFPSDSYVGNVENFYDGLIVCRPVRQAMIRSLQNFLRLLICSYVGQSVIKF